MLFNELFYENNQNFNPFLHIRQLGQLIKDKDYLIERSNSKTNVMGYIVSGTLHIDTDDKSYSLNTGCSFIIVKDVHYKMYSDKDYPCTMLWINIRGPLFESTIRSLFSDDYFIFANFNLEKQFHTLSELVAETSDQTNQIMKLIIGLVIDLWPSRFYLDDTSSQGEKSLKQQYDHYISDQVQYRFSVKNMANHFHISIDKLNRIFKTEFHTTPYQYYQDIRLSLSTSLLLNTNLTIEAISDKLGFSNRNNFTAFYISKAGIPPVQLRKSNGI